jgi:hypothetical protein
LNTSLRQEESWNAEVGDTVTTSPMDPVLENITAYGSFQDWLDAFLPNDSNHVEHLNMLDVDNTTHATASPFFQADSTTSESTIEPFANPGKLRIDIRNLKQPHSASNMMQSESIELEPSDYVYKLIQILHDRG